jgi:hypothetical protein
MAVAELKLFGVFELKLSDGRLADLPGQKDRALLAIVALAEGAPRSRDKRLACCGATAATRRRATA